MVIVYIDSGEIFYIYAFKKVMIKIRKSMMKGYFLFMNLLFAVCFSSFGQDFEIAPVLVNFDANPGETQTKTLTLRNHSPERQKFVLNLTDYELSPDGSKKQVETGVFPHSLFNWININPAFVELNPNESAEISLILNVPRDGFNTRWGMIHAQVAREQSPSEADKQLATGVVLVPRIVVLVQQSPRANLNYKAGIKAFRETTNPGDTRRNFEAIVINSGDKVIDAKLSLALANLQTSEEKQFNATTVTVYPGFERNVSLTLPVSLEKGSWVLAVLMDYGNNTAIEGAQLLLEVK